MDAMLENVIFYGPFLFMGVLAVGAAVVAVTAWRRAWTMDGSLPLDEMLARQGVELPKDIKAGSAYEVALAARRCAGCGARGACRSWLDSGARSGIEEFCPNYAFIERAKHEGMSLGVPVL